MTSQSDFLAENIRAGLSPPSTMARWVLRSLFALLVVVVCLICFGRLDRTAVAHGRLVPAVRAQAIQAPLGGVVATINVVEGQRVEKGEVLVLLDSGATAAQHSSSQTQLAASQMEISRVEAQLNGRQWKPQQGSSSVLAGQVEARFRSEVEAQHLLETQEVLAEKRLLQEQAALDNQVVELEALLSRHRQEEAAMSRLIEKGHISRLQVLAKERERISAEQQLEASKHRLESARHAVAQQNSRVRGVRAEYRRRLDEERLQLTRDVQQQSAALAQADAGAQSTVLTAPIAGVVTDLSITGKGAVLRPGEPVLTIVPDDELLKAEVWLENSDMSHVDTGQPVRLKVMAVDFRRYGPIPATVSQIAADATPAPLSLTATGEAMVDPSLPANSFKAFVTIDRSESGGKFKGIPLRAGMRVTAEIVVGRRTVLEYLLSPVVATLDEAGKET